MQRDLSFDWLTDKGTYRGSQYNNVVTPLPSDIPKSKMSNQVWLIWYIGFRKKLYGKTNIRTDNVTCRSYQLKPRSINQNIKGVFLTTNLPNHLYLKVFSFPYLIYILTQICLILMSVSVQILSFIWSVNYSKTCC